MLVEAKNKRKRRGREGEKRRERVSRKEKKFGSVARACACIYNCTLRLPTEAGHLGTLPAHKFSSLRGGGQVPTAPEDFTSKEEKHLGRDRTLWEIKQLFFAFFCPSKGPQKEMRRFFGVGRGEKQKKKEKKRRRKRRRRVCGEEKKFGPVAKVVACV